MGKGDEIINVELPPSYNSPTVSGPAVAYAGFNHPSDNNSGNPLDKLIAGNYPGHGIVSVPNAPTEPGHSLDLLQDLLAGHGKLTFHQSQKLARRNDSIICQIRGQDNQMVMSTLITAMSLYGRSAPTLRSFVDQTGKVLFITQSAGQNYSVSSGDRVIGLVSGASVSLGWSRHLEGHCISGNTIFKVVRHGSEHHFESHGRIIAVAGMSGKVFELEFKDESLDVQSRALVITAAYYLFEMHHMETVLGCRGSSTFKNFFLTVVMLFLVLLLTTRITD